MSADTPDEESEGEGPGEAVALLQDSVKSFDTTDDGIHAMTLSGGIGFHAFYSSHPDESLAAASTAAFHVAIENISEEVAVDGEIIEHRYGEVTPKTIAEEMTAQVEEFLGLSHYSAEAFEEEVVEFLRREEQDRDRLRVRGEHHTLDEYVPRVDEEEDSDA